MLEKMWFKENIHPLLVRMHTCTTTLEISMVVSQKIWNPPTSGPIPLLSIYPKVVQSYYKGIHSTVFIAGLFVIVRTWKQPRCPSTEEWIKKMWHIYILEYYAAVKAMTS